MTWLSNIIPYIEYTLYCITVDCLESGPGCTVGVRVVCVARWQQHALKHDFAAAFKAVLTWRSSGTAVTFMVGYVLQF